jgi:hypothetical protein
MTNLKKAAQQALEALIAITTRTCAGTDGMDITPINDAFDMADTAITALRAALEQPEQDNFPEEKLQAVAEYFGDKYHVWYGIGARDVEEVLHQSVRRGLVTLNFDTGEQPEQEPLAIATVDESLGVVFKFSRPHTLLPGQMLYVYTHPPRREWRSLSEEEILPLYSMLPSSHAEMLEFARAVEQALKEKNYE